MHRYTISCTIYINCTEIITALTCEKYYNLTMVDSNCTANICVLYDVSNTGCISEIVDQNLWILKF